MKRFSLLLAALAFCFGLKAQCPHSEAIDFTATDCHGTEIHLFDILDRGQSVLIDFFYTTCGPCQQATPKVAEAYTRLGCNMHDVFFLEITPYDNDAACQNWCQNYGIEYPTVGTNGGGSAICSQYGIEAYPTVILITPDRRIVINDLWPINNSQSIVDQLAPYGIQENDCTVVEDPSLEILIGEVTPTTVEAAFIPNETCASYWFMIGTEEEMAMWEQMLQMTLPELIQMFGINDSIIASYKWFDQIPGTEYTIYALPFDENGNAYDIVTEVVTTTSPGGTGLAVIDIQIEILSETSVRTTSTPNEETAEYHCGLITKELFDEMGEEAAVQLFRDDNYPLYAVEIFTWENNITPNTWYYALTTGKNSLGEWGETTLVPFYTSLTGVAENNGSAFNIYPNPANDVINITGTAIETISINNLLGQKIDEFVVNGDQAIIATSNYENGIYFVKVNGKDTYRFVVTH